MSTPPKVRPQMILHAQQGVAWTVFDTKWVPSSARFAAVGGYARGTGTIQVFELNHGKLELRSEIERFSTFKCATFGASSIEDRHISVGDFDGRLSIWDLENSSLPVYTVKAHDKIINAIDGAGGLNMQGPPEIVTGGRDGCVKIWDPRQKEKPVLNLEPASSSSSSSSASAGGGVPDCWAVAFGNAYSDVERCVVAGFSNGDVKLFDLRTSTMRWETNVKNGVCSLEFDRKDIEMNKLLVTGLEGRFRVYDMRTYHPEKGYAYVQEKAHESTIWCGRHLPQNREVFITAGGAGGLHLYKYSYPCQRAKKDAEGVAEGVPGSVTLLNKTTVSTQPVCSIDWHRDKEGLACMAAFDQAVRVLIVTPNY